MQIDSNDIVKLIQNQQQALGAGSGIGAGVGNSPLVEDITSQILPTTGEILPQEESTVDWIKRNLGDVLDILRMVDEIVGIFVSDPNTNDPKLLKIPEGKVGNTPYIIKADDDTPEPEVKQAEVIQPSGKIIPSADDTIAYIETLQKVFGEDISLKDLKDLAANG